MQLSASQRWHARGTGELRRCFTAGAMPRSFSALAVRLLDEQDAVADGPARDQKIWRAAGIVLP